MNKTLAFAYECPFCGREGGTSLEEQEITIRDGKIHIFNGFDCMYCNDSWFQNIVVVPGEVVKNVVEFSGDVIEDDEDDDA